MVAFYIPFTQTVFELQAFTMRYSLLTCVSLAQALVIRQEPAFAPGADGKYTISAPGIKAQFIDYGASLTNLYVKDKNGKDVDVVLGYDDIDFYRNHFLVNLSSCHMPSLTLVQPSTLVIQFTIPSLAATSTASVTPSTQSTTQPTTPK